MGTLQKAASRGCRSGMGVVFVRAAPQSPPGYFGKLPWAGDFLRARLPAAVCDHIDRCTREGLQALAARHGNGWQEVFLDGPAWAWFVLAGTLDAQSWLGLWLPSEDRVGRCFGFSVAVALQAQTGLPPAVSAAAPVACAQGPGAAAGVAPAPAATSAPDQPLLDWLLALDTAQEALARPGCPLPSSFQLPWTEVAPNGRDGPVRRAEQRAAALPSAIAGRSRAAHRRTARMKAVLRSSGQAVKRSSGQAVSLALTLGSSSRLSSLHASCALKVGSSRGFRCVARSVSPTRAALTSLELRTGCDGSSGALISR